MSGSHNRCHELPQRRRPFRGSRRRTPGDQVRCRSRNSSPPRRRRAGCAITPGARLGGNSSSVRDSTYSTGTRIRCSSGVTSYASIARPENQQRIRVELLRPDRGQARDLRFGRVHAVALQRLDPQRQHAVEPCPACRSNRRRASSDRARTAQTVSPRDRGSARAAMTPPARRRPCRRETSPPTGTPGTRRMTGPPPRADACTPRCCSR